MRSSGECALLASFTTSPAYEAAVTMTNHCINLVARDGLVTFCCVFFSLCTQMFFLEFRIVLRLLACNLPASQGFMKNSDLLSGVWVDPWLTHRAHPLSDVLALSVCVSQVESL